MSSATNFSNIIICDDHHVSALGVEMLLRNYIPNSPQIRVASNGKKALELFIQKIPDLMIVDLDLPDIHGREIIKQVRKISPSLRVIVLTGIDEAHTLRQVYQLKVQGILRKTGTSQNLGDALHSAKVNESKTYLDFSVSNLLQAVTDKALTPREYEVLELMAKGHKSGEIAEKMKCSVATVKTYRARIMGKSGARNSAEMMAWFLKGNRNKNGSSYS